MSRWSDDEIRRIREHSPILDVVREAATIIQRGDGSWAAQCPIHTETRPSFVVRPEHGTFHCFGCGSHGSVIDFVMIWRECTYTDAIKWLWLRLLKTG